MKMTPSSDKKPTSGSRSTNPRASDVAQLIPGFLHTLNNSLCGVVNSITFLEEDLAEDPQRLKTVQELEQATDRLIKTVAAMQLFVRDGTNAVSALPADQLLELGIQLVRPLYHAKGRQITLDSDGIFASIPSENVTHFLQASMLLLMRVLEATAAPPTLSVEARTIKRTESKTFWWGFSCQATPGLGNVWQNCRPCELLLKKFHGSLTIKKEKVNLYRFEIQVPTSEGVILNSQ